MRKSVLIFALALLPALSLSAGNIVTDSLYSKTLSSSVTYNVYLPDGFGKSSEHYPVIYLLHGLSDDYRAWKEWGAMQRVADQLIRSGEMRPAVVVMPNAGGPDVHNTWCGYFNMPGWKYEDFFFGEFIEAVEAKYACGGSKTSRAVMGLSMGGGGSVVYCQRHPELFCACYAMSPWLDNKWDEVVKEKASKDCLYYVGKAVREHSALDFLDHADEAALSSLRTVAWFVDCGDDDFLLDQSLAFYQKMRGRVNCQLRVRDGMHNWEYWHAALHTAFPFASRNFEK